MLFYLSLRLGLLLARLFPPRLFVGGAARLFRLCSFFSPARRVVRENLALLRPGAIGAGEVFENYGCYWGELLVRAARPDLELPDSIRIEGEEHFRRAKARGPVCVLTGHLGNWDLGATWLATRLENLAVLAETLQPPALFALFTRIRERGGARVLPAEGRGLQLFRHLRDGGHCAMLVDRAVGEERRGLESAPFFGGRRSFPAAGMALARRAGADLLPMFLLREAGGYVIKVHPPLSPEADPVSAFAAILEAEVREHPEQWCMLYPLHDAEPASAAMGEGRVKGVATP